MIFIQVLYWEKMVIHFYVLFSVHFINHILLLSFTVGFESIKNVQSDIFPKIFKTKDSCTPIQEVFICFLNKLQEAIEVLEQPVFVSSANDELSIKQTFITTQLAIEKLC